MEKTRFDVVPDRRMLCSQAPFCKGTPWSTKGPLSSGETHGWKKTKRDTGKASGSLFLSEKLSSVRLFEGRLWARRGVWIKAETHWKRQGEGEACGGGAGEMRTLAKCPGRASDRGWQRGPYASAGGSKKSPEKWPFAFLYSMKALGGPLPQRLPSCEQNLGRREHFPCWEIIPAERGGQQQAHPGERCASASSAPGSTAPTPGASQPPAPLGVLFSPHRFRCGCAATLGSSRVLDRKQTPNSTAFFFQLHVCCLDAIPAGSLVPGREGLAGCAGTRGRSPGSSFARAELAL